MRRIPKPKDKLKVVAESKEHSFKENELVEVTEVLAYGVVWARNENKNFGCLIPDDYMFVDSAEKQGP